MEGTCQLALVDYKNLYLALPLGHNSDTHIYLNHLHVQFLTRVYRSAFAVVPWACQRKARPSLRLQTVVYGIHKLFEMANLPSEANKDLLRSEKVTDVAKKN